MTEHSTELTYSLRQLLSQGKHPTVEIIWLNRENIRVRTVGYLREEHQYTIMLLQSQGISREYYMMHTEFIPKQSIESIKELT